MVAKLTRPVQILSRTSSSGDKRREHMLFAPTGVKLVLGIIMFETLSYLMHQPDSKWLILGFLKVLI